MFDSGSKHMVRMVGNSSFSFTIPEIRQSVFNGSVQKKCFDLSILVVPNSLQRFDRKYTDVIYGNFEIATFEEVER